MQVNCPNCGEKVTAENINIQKMTAVCAACDTVFPFDLSVPEAKAKRRKVKQPLKLMLREDDTLHMEFWTNFRLDQSEAFLSGIFGIISLFISLLIMMSSSDAPFILPLSFLLAAVGLFYWMALTVVNKTHIVMDEDSISVTRKPLPNPLVQAHKVLLAGVTAIKYEETPISKKEGFDTPRFRVWAEMADGSRRIIVTDMIEEYAVFITQRLEERLYATDTEADRDVSRLEDGAQRLEDEVSLYDFMRDSQNNAQP